MTTVRRNKKVDTHDSDAPGVGASESPSPPFSASPTLRVSESPGRGVSESSGSGVPALPDLRVSVLPDSTVRVSPDPRPSAIRASTSALITLLTDFGTADYFVSAMKGVILSSNRDARIVDITHEIPAQDIEAAAFTLLAVRSSYSRGTIFLAVVDPGVGSDRRAILVEAGGQLFVGPDNGIFSYVYDGEPQTRVFEVTNKKYLPSPLSSTFHGRDVFAPVAAALSKGIVPAEFGTLITDPIRLTPLAPEETKNGKVKGRIIHIDHFGNCITNITPRELTENMIADGAYLVTNGAKVKSFRSFYAEPGGRRKEVFAIWGSAGFLELAAKDKSAAKILKAKRGARVVLHRSKD